MGRSGYVYEEQRRTYAPDDGEAFDRVEYAMRALRVLRPRELTIAVRETAQYDFKVEAGRAWDRGPGARWVIMAIPRTASREEIVVRVAELTGIEKSTLAIAVLMAGADGVAQGDDEAS